MAHNARKALSYLSGPSSRPLLGETIGQAFDSTVRRAPHKLALVSRHDGVKWSFERFKHDVDKLATGLLKLGLRKGDNIAIWALNGSDWATTQVAAAKAGLGLLACNPGYRTTEIEYALKKVGCKALITSSSFKTSHFDSILRQVMPELNSCSPGHLHSKAVPSLQHVIALGPSQVGDGSHGGRLDGESKLHPSLQHEYPGMHRYADVLSLAVESDVSEMQRLSDTTLDSDDVISLQLTSGTTGLPKATGLSHHNILNNAVIVGGNIGLTEEDRVLINPPLFHCMGQVMSSLASLYYGSTALYPAPSFDAGAALALAADAGATVVNGVPTMFIGMLNHATEPALRAKLASTFRTGIMAGSVCPIELMRQVEKQWGLKELCICYGMTETSPVSTQTSRDDPEWARTQTVGRVAPHTEVKVVDPATGATLPRGSPGELCTRGYCVMRGGYWGEPEKTAEAIDEHGWMHTGDLATVDDEGYVRIVGRIKDMIIRGGENVFPREVEDYLYSHPAVADVSVFGVADKIMGEEIAAYIVLKEGYTAAEDEPESASAGHHHPSGHGHAGMRKGSHGHSAGPAVDSKAVAPHTIKAFCRGHIAHYKVPKYVQFVPGFPTTGSGKIQKFVMREELERQLGLRT